MATRLEAIRIPRAVTTALYVGDCPECGVIFGITTEMEARRRSDGATFYCPNGHSMSFGASEAARLKDELKRKQSSLDWYSNANQRERAAREAAENSLRTTKGHLTRAKNRARAGLCQDCNRTFQNVARHMQTKHGATNEPMTGMEAERK